MKPVIIAPTRIEPARIEGEIDIALAESALSLARASDRLGAGLPSATLAQVAAMIRVMNSYYSNRIEGNNTRPREIEAALAGEFDEDPRRRALQQESAAHVRLQAEIDRRAASGTLEDPSEPDFIRWLHLEFYRDVDATALVLREGNPGGEGRIVIQPGEWRDGDVERLRARQCVAAETLPGADDRWRATARRTRMTPCRAEPYRGLQFKEGSGMNRQPALSRRALLAGMAAMPLASAPLIARASQLPLVTVHRDPSCGCCGAWVDHIEAAGFPVRVIETSDLDTEKRRLGVPAELASCHTAEVSGYVVEGHVPAPAIRRLLSERPNATGLAVPGMPTGSPGMEIPGVAPERFEVVLFGPAGRARFGEFIGGEEI